MKITSKIIVALIPCIFVAAPAFAQTQIGGGTCATMLSGTYFYVLGGEVLSGSQTLPYAELGKLIADGNGHVSGQSVVSLSGTSGTFSLSGSYSVQGNCAGTITLTVNAQSTETLTFQVTNGGLGANVAVSTPGAVVVGRAYRQTASASAATQCGNGSLSGSYGYLLTGFRFSANSTLLYADDGQVISDGNGHLSASSVANLGGVVGTTTGSGTYTITADCSGTAHISNANGTLDYLVAAVEDGQGVLFIGTDPGYTISGSGQPQFSAPQGSIVNSGSFAPQSLSPGSLFSVFGVNLSQQTASAQALPLPRTLASTQVLVNGSPAPLFYVAPGQINAQMPFEVPQWTPVSLAVNNGSTTSNAVTVNLSAASPGVFTYGNNDAVVQNQDGSLNSDASPAHPDDVVVTYLTGGSAVNPSGPLSTGAASPSGLSQVTSSYSVIVGGQQANVLYFGLTPSLVGVYQINFKVPTLGAGRFPIAAVVGGVASNGPTISVGQ